MNYEVVKGTNALGQTVWRGSARSSGNRMRFVEDRIGPMIIRDCAHRWKFIAWLHARRSWRTYARKLWSETGR